jgi:hypothetical protein
MAATLGGESLGGVGIAARVAVLQHITFIGQLDGRRHHLGAGHGAVFLQHLFHAHHGAGHADRLVAMDGKAGDDIAVGVQIHVGAGGRRRFFAEVDKGVLAVGEMDSGEAAAANIAAAGMHHRERIAHRHRGIDRVAARGQDFRARLGGVALGAHRHAIGRFDRRREFLRHIGAVEFGDIGIGGLLTKTGGRCQ